MHESNLYEALGATAGCRAISAAFYARVERDPTLRPLFPGSTLRCATEEFAAFLVQFLGGPSEDSQRRWWVSLRESHMRFKIGAKERDAWLANMALALTDVPIEEPLRAQLAAFFELSSANLINEEEAVAPDHSQLSLRWEAQTKVDQAVAAIREGDARRAIELTEGSAALCGLLALMIRHGQTAMLDYVRTKLTANPNLAQERYAGRTLLHEAAAAGSVALIELLLSLGAAPNAASSGGHSPLYCLANECVANDAGNAVRKLVQSGADMNACDGVKRCTPLHMAARRGNVEVARALLACGAHIEARDKLGETPLRRAVNCNKTGVAALLLAHGADTHSIAKKGSTPYLAARSIAMKQLLQTPQ